MENGNEGCRATHSAFVACRGALGDFGCKIIHFKMGRVSKRKRHLRGLAESRKRKSQAAASSSVVAVVESNDDESDEFSDGRSDASDSSSSTGADSSPEDDGEVVLMLLADDDDEAECDADGGDGNGDEGGDPAPTRLNAYSTSHDEARLPAARGFHRSTVFRRRQAKEKLNQAAMGCHSLHKFYRRKGEASADAEARPIRSQPSTNILKDKKKVKEAVERLRKLKLNSNKTVRSQARSLPKVQLLQFLSVLRFLVLVQSDPATSVTSSEAVAAAIYYEATKHSSDEFAGRRTFKNRGATIRKWAKEYVLTGSISQPNQGKHCKTSSLIHDEDVIVFLKDAIRSLSPNQRSPDMLRQIVEKELHVLLFLTTPVKICLKTARRWLKELGFEKKRRQKGSAYVDGHERADVVAARNEYVETWFNSFQPRLIHYKGPNLAEMEVPDVQGQRILVDVYQDETCFFANDGAREVYLAEGEQSLLPKSQGNSYMYSGFICSCHGPLRLSEEQQRANPGVRPDACQFFEPGKNPDGYFCNEHLVEQAQNAMKVCDILHPPDKYQAVFIFDHSTTHEKMPDDALVANRLNIKDGGKKVKLMRDGWIVKADGTKEPFKMQKEVDGKLVQKGLETIAKERGMPWPPEPVPGITGKDRKRRWARIALSKQPDFVAQQSSSRLKEVIEGSGHLFSFLPKFHCEFNPIEMYWALLKQYTRRNCDYTWKGLKQSLPLAIASVSITVIRRMFQNVYRHLHAYHFRDDDQKGLTTSQVARAVKKFTRHRSIPPEYMQNLIRDDDEAV